MKPQTKKEEILALTGIMALVVALTYDWIEKPARRWMRNYNPTNPSSKF